MCGEICLNLSHVLRICKCRKLRSTLVVKAKSKQLLTINWQFYDTLNNWSTIPVSFMSSMFFVNYKLFVEDWCVGVFRLLILSTLFMCLGYCWLFKVFCFCLVICILFVGSFIPKLKKTYLNIENFIRNLTLLFRCKETNLLRNLNYCIYVAL